MPKQTGGLHSPMTPIYPAPSPHELAGGTDRMDIGPAPAPGVISKVIHTGETGVPAPMNTPLQHPIMHKK